MNTIVKEKPVKKQKAAAEIPAQEPESIFEKAIILRPISMNLGNIETNIEAVLAAVKEKSEQYQDVTKYIGDEKQAKEDRALLRKQKDATKTTIASIQEAWNKPLEVFLNGGKQIVKQFDFAINSIDEWVKNGETLEKEKKREHIQAYFDGKNFDLVSLDRLFDNRWLNKTYDIRDVKKDIDTAIETIYGNIKILESIADHGMTAKALYLETLDMGEAMRRVETLKANAERLAREQASREDRAIQEQVAQNAAAERREERETAKEERTLSLVDQALDLPEGTTAAEAKQEILAYTMTFNGTKEQLFKLREFMTANGIAYRKGYVFDNSDHARQVASAKKIEGTIYSFIYAEDKDIRKTA
jgi:vacuolar-type H+-ATPase subunit E/Vma4